MENVLWGMMITNARVYIDTFDPKKEDSDRITIFQISEVLALLTGKLKEDIVIEITSK